jgi:hypothetical protein
MARRRRKFARKRTSGWLTAVQVMLLVAVLIFIVFFRDFIADGAGEVFDTFGGTDDVRVEGSAEPSSQNDSDEPVLQAPESPSHRDADAGAPDATATD